MATAKRLQSGNYRVRVYDKDTKKYKSFTARTKREAELMGLDWLNGRKKTTQTEITVDEAVENYINSKNNTLSVSTIRGYYIIKNNAIDDIKSIKLNQITEIDLQNWMNKNASKYSAKSIRNQFGLVIAALKQNKVNLDFNSILLKPKQPSKIKVPNIDEIKKIIDITHNTNIEIPILLAITLGLRRSEICALKWSDYNGREIYIHSAAVPNANNKTVIKQTNKSYAGTRTLIVPDILKCSLDKNVSDRNDFIVKMTPNGIFVRFQSLCQQNGLEKYTLHSLRHANASLMLLQGVPDKYAMERLGQATNSMLRNVYQHTFKNEQEKIADDINDKFNSLF